MAVGGVTVFGPGSEWLWTMAQFVALSVTGIAIFRQLRAQAWANQLKLFQQFSNDFNDERMIRTKLAALIDVSRGARGLTPSIEVVGQFFENIGEGRYHGHMHPRYAWEEYGLVAQRYWSVFEPILPDLRRADPDLWQGWERWLGEVRERDRRAGKTVEFSPQRAAAWIPETIAYYIERLRIEEEMKSGVIPTWPPPEASAASPAIDAPAPRFPAEDSKETGRSKRS
ncbi:MAG TPA: hypothetical protein VGQ85_06130 [Candidatus Limnocylindrales bacterium]|nr:hypothetical protein [Candidatus Limnocylindrales bacterium]